MQALSNKVSGPVSVAGPRASRATVGAGLALVLRAVYPLLVEPYQAILLSYGLVMGMAALAFNLLLGYTGLLSFGHAAFFGGGAYAVGLLMRYTGFTCMEALLAGGVLLALVLAAIFGFVCVRHTRIYFSILTLALAQVLWGLVLKLYWVTGGTDGIRVRTPALLGGLIPPASDKVHFLSVTYYYYILAAFVLCVAAMWLIVHSPMGKAFEAIRDNEVRARFVGIPVERLRWVAFMISAGFTGLAGALWAPLNGLVAPDQLFWTFSGEIAFMTILGGFHSFVGPILGGIAFQYLKTYAVGYTVYWQALLGLILIGIVFVAPEGLVGVAAWVRTAWRRSR